MVHPGCIAAVLGLVLASCESLPAATLLAPPPLPAFDMTQQRGHDFAVNRCSGCHTVGLDEGGASDGPAFRSLANRYTPLSLERRFAEISVHGFDRMPPLEITPATAADLVAYFDTLHGN